MPSRDRSPRPALIALAVFAVTFLTIPFAPLIAAPDTDPSLPAHRAHWQLLSRSDASVRLEVRIPALGEQSLTLADESFLALSLDGGGILGADGTPGLPVTGHLVAVPQGARISARVVSFEARELAGGRLLPVQPPQSESLVLDRAAYARAGWTHVATAADHALTAAVDAPRRTDGAAPTVLVGRPAIMAGQAVVPVTVVPVAHDPVARRTVAMDRVVIELRFDASEGPLAPRSRRDAAAPVLSAGLAGAILGLDAPRDVAPPDQSPGTWALVYRTADVRAHLQPLVDWRARQGYHVELIQSSGPAAFIKSQLQALYDDPDLPPLRFILLAGDIDTTYGVPTWYETLSGYGGEGDHAYATLDGDDILADAHVGRLTFSDYATLDGIVAKIVAYETAPPTDQTDWFDEACLIGDPYDSGITTIYVNQWLKGQLLANGYAAVDTIWSGNFLGQMLASVNSGKSAFGYRGFWNMSGISPSHIQSLQNGGRLPVALLPTCDTGSFAGSYVCHSEAWLHAANGGGIAAVGTATLGTHTRYNNCYYQGTWHGLLNAGDPRIGVAHTLGKVAIYDNYYLAEPDPAEIWAVWNNIMGDPATAIWMGRPAQLAASHPAQLAVGAGAVECLVTSDGLPAAGAWVCLYRAGAVQATGLTDEVGHVLLPTPPLGEGAYELTVTAVDALPYLGSLQVGTADVACSLSDQLLDDSAGNGDGTLNPGETVSVSLAVTNDGTQLAAGVVGTLTGGGPWTTVTTADLDFGDIAPGAQAWSQAPAVISVDPAAPDGAPVAWPLALSDGSDTWIAVAQAVVHAAAFTVTDHTWSGGATFEPGQSGQLVLSLTNHGSLTATAVSAVLSTDSPWLEITDPTASFGTIGVGATGNNTFSPLALTIAADCFAGHLAVLRLAITYGAGLQAMAEFPITVGTAATDDPTGPGAGGYYAFDDTDTGTWYAPTYDWVALDPDHGGSGTALGLTDYGWEQDDTRTVDLPFTFRYDGVDFEQVSICSNGWLAMGETPLVDYRNVTIPSAGAPGYLIAPFWDNLYQTAGGQVYTQHDEVGHRFIVQWYNLVNDYSVSNQNFEVILLDPLWHPTATGDGAIIFQYATVANTDSRDGYATVGLQNGDVTGGLLYSYWNQYAAGAAPLASGRAIRFQPLGEVLVPEASVDPASFTAVLPPGEQVELTLHIANTGPEGSVLGYAIDTVDPATLPPLAKSADGDSGSPRLDIQGSTMTMDTATYEAGTTVSIDATIHAEGPTGFLTVARLQMPAGVTLNQATDFLRNGNSTLFWLGEAGDGVLTSWDGLDGEWIRYIPAGETATATLDLTFGEALVGDLSFQYVLEDIGLFGDPDQVVDTIVLSSDQPGIAVLEPTADTVAVIGQALDIAFAAFNGSGQVDIALQRESDGPWEDLATGVDAAAGLWSWTVTGEPGPYARIRIADAVDPGVVGESEVFVVGRDVSWVALDGNQGAVVAGGQAAIAVTLDATGLAPGPYEAALKVDLSTGETVVVPIDLVVDASTAVGDALPAAVTLLGNHPNPFNPTTAITYALPRSMTVGLDVYSLRGQRVRRLLQGRQTAGVHHALWDGRDQRGRAVASGVYLARLVTEEGALVSKMLLAK